MRTANSHASQKEAQYRQLTWLLILGGLTFVGIVCFLVSPTSVLSYCYLLLLAVAAYRWLAGSNITEAFLLYVFYTFLALFLYLLQNNLLPDSNKALGDTNDALHYFYATSWLPEIWTSSFALNVPSSNFIRVMRLMFWFPVGHPLDTLFYSVVPLVLLPRITYQIAIRVTQNLGIARQAFFFVLFCPFLFATSMVFIQAGWTALAFTGAILFTLSRTYIKLGVVLVFLLFVDLNAALALATVVGLTAMWGRLRQPYGSRMPLYIVGIFCLLTISGVTLVATIVSQFISTSGGQSISTVGVASGLQTVLDPNNTDPIWIGFTGQPIGIRLPLTFAYLFLSPYFAPQIVTASGHFSLTLALTNVLFPTLMILYIGCFTKAAWSAWYFNDTTLQLVLVAYLVALLIISFGSVQYQHKALLMPLFYVVVAFGTHQDTSIGNIIGLISSGAALLVFLFTH